jgi:hypothetical protein
MKKLLILLMLVPTSGGLLLISKADAANDESEIQQLLDKWPKAARAHDVNSVMSIYAPEVIAFEKVWLDLRRHSNNRLTDGYGVFSTTETVSFRGIFDVEPFEFPRLSPFELRGW